MTRKVATMFFAYLFSLICLADEVSKDTLGAISSLGEGDVIRAMSKIIKGKTYSLAIETSSRTPAYNSRKYSIEVKKSKRPLGSNKITGLDDKVETHLGIGSQIDGLGHVGTNFFHYNNIHLSEFYSEEGITIFGVEKLPPIVTRGILLDMAKYYDFEIVPAGTAYNETDIQGALKSQDLEIEKGDVVIFHSGWSLKNIKDGKKWITSHPGLSEKGARYLASKGVVAVGADSPAVEVLPVEIEGKVFPVHQILLVENGIYILESLNTEELSVNEVDDFMFVLGVPKLSGSVQAIINPVAIY